MRKTLKWIIKLSGLSLIPQIGIIGYIYNLHMSITLISLCIFGFVLSGLVSLFAFLLSQDNDWWKSYEDFVSAKEIYHQRSKAHEDMIDTIKHKILSKISLIQDIELKFNDLEEEV